MKSIVEHILSIRAKAALTAPGYADQPSQCQKWMRQVVFATYGPIFEQYRAFNALQSMELWKHSTHALKPSRGSLVGDILYYGLSHGINGHVVIRIPNNLVAENSVVHHDRKYGARGTRELWQLGTPDLIVRLPSAVKKTPHRT